MSRNTRILPALVVPLLAALPACGSFAWHQAMPWDWAPRAQKKFDWRTPNWRTPTLGLSLSPPAPESTAPRPPSLLYPEPTRPPARPAPAPLLYPGSPVPAGTQSRTAPLPSQPKPREPEEPTPDRKAPPPYMRETRRAPASHGMALSADARRRLVSERRA